MTEFVKIIKHDFDTLENHNPHYSKELGIFIAGDGLSAYGKASKFIQEMEPVRLYTGYDSCVYPRLELVVGYLK